MQANNEAVKRFTSAAIDVQISPRKWKRASESGTFRPLRQIIQNRNAVKP